VTRSGRDADGDRSEREKRGDEEGKSPGTPPRRSRARTQLRAALALEEAGELRDAARLFEYVGEHAQASSLRLEHANTLGDDRQRLRVLREGASRNPGDTEQGRALHRALGKALSLHAEALDSGPRARALRLEAAQALEEADRGAEAGEIYEALGLLSHAARAYERSGAITRLELVLSLLDHRERAERDLVETAREVDEAWKDGRRRLAREILEEHVRHRRHHGLSPRADLARRLGRLDAQVARRRRIRLGLRPPDGPPRDVTIVSSAEFRIGRSPQAELTLRGATLSREHVRVELTRDDDGRAQLLIVDLGSRAGSFWNGEPIEPGHPVEIEDEGELALGMDTELRIHPCRDDGEIVGALLRASENSGWTYFLPKSGRLRFDPETLVDVQVTCDDDFVTVDLPGESSAHLEAQPLGRGATVELLLFDRIVLEGPGESLEIRVLDEPEVAP
jgi:tetratricopeptide (TPR) repeat protein